MRSFNKICTTCASAAASWAALSVHVKLRHAKRGREREREGESRGAWCVSNQIEERGAQLWQCGGACERRWWR